MVITRLKRYVYLAVAALALCAALLAASPAVAQEAQAERVVVRPGDTLWTISAEALGADATPQQIASEAERIYALNRDQIGPDPNLIFPGQKFLVPPALSERSTGATPARKTIATRKTTEAVDTARLTVEPGDSLWSISRQRLGSGATTQQIARELNWLYVLNRDTIGEDPNLILGGQELLVMPVRKPATAKRPDGQAAPQPASEPARNHVPKQLSKPVPNKQQSESAQRSLPERSPALTNKRSPARVSEKSPVATFVSEVYDHGRLLFSWGILLLTLIVGGLMAWKLPMKRRTGGVSSNGATSGPVRVVPIEFYRLHFETKTEGLLLATTDGTVLDVNREGCRLLRRTREEILAVGFGVFDPSDSRVESALWDLHKTGRFVGRMRILRGGAQPSVAEASVTGWRIGGKAVIGIAFRLLDDRDRTRREGAAEGITGGEHAAPMPFSGEKRQRASIERSTESIYVIDPEPRRIVETNPPLQAMFGYTADELRGMKIYDLVVHEREEVDYELRRTLEEQYRFVGEQVHRRKDGTLVQVEVVASSLRYGNRDTICAVLRDVTERKHKEESLKSSLDKLLALREAGQAFGSTLRLEELSTRLLRIMQRISGFSTAVISMPDERRQLRVYHAIGFANLWHKARYAPEVQEALRSVLKTGEHLHFRLRHLDTDREWLAALFLPLRVRNRVIGVLEVYGPETLAEKDTVGILKGLANQAANALDNAQLYEALTEREKRLEELIGKLFAAQEEERRRVAYEVHDGLGQLVIAAYQHLQAFARSHAPRSEQERALLEQVLRLVRRTVGETRRVIAGLRPTALDDFGLQTAVRLEVEALRTEGWTVDYEGSLREGARLPAAVETALFRIVQEALSNVRKHAGTGKVRLSLKRSGDKINLTVRDWGRGFDPASALNGGHTGESVGLASMKERVALLRGELKIFSQPGSGTVVRAEVPLTRQGEDGGEGWARDAN